MILAICIGNKRKIGAKELTGGSVPHLLTAYTQHLEILVTALKI